MKISQKLQVEQSEKRQRANDLLGQDKLEDEQRDELGAVTGRLQQIEVELRAALVVEGTEHDEAVGQFADGSLDNDKAEVRALLGAVSLNDYLRPASAGSGTEGRARELNEALDLPTIGKGGGVAIPWRVLLPDGGLETRASTTTAALDGGSAQRPILDRLFGSKGVLDFLGVRMDEVPVGMSEWPLLTSGVAPEQRAEDAAGPDAVTAGFATAVLKPKRLTGEYVYTVEMAAQVANLEAALRRDLQMAVDARMCTEIISAPVAAQNIVGGGFLTKLTAPTAPTAAPLYAVAAALGGASTVIDGLHASMESQTKIVVGPHGYRVLAQITGSGSDEAATMALARRTGGLMASPFIPDPASDVQDILVHGGNDMMRGDSVAAMWPVLEVIRDIYSGAKEGRVALTWVALWDAYVAFRADAYERASIFTG